jgi:hypothetical protein
MTGNYSQYTVWLSVKYYPSLKTVENTRVYKTLIDVIGTIGGVNDFILVISSYIYMMLTSNIQKKYIVEKVFGIVPATSRYLCFKKRKGNKGEKNARGSYFVSSEIFDRAHETILSSIDIFTLSHELFVLRFISRALLSDFHLNLMPLIALNHFTPKENTKEDQSQPKADPKKSESKVDYRPEEDQMDQIRGWPEISKLNESRRQNEGELDSPNSHMEQVPDMPMNLELVKISSLIGKVAARYSCNNDGTDLIPQVEKAWVKLKASLGEKLQTFEVGSPQSIERSPIIGQQPSPVNHVRDLLDRYFSEECNKLIEVSDFKPFLEEAKSESDERTPQIETFKAPIQMNDLHTNVGHLEEGQIQSPMTKTPPSIRK